MAYQLKTINNGFTIVKDNRSISTPGGNKIIVPSLELATIIMKAMDASRIDKADNLAAYALRLVNTAIDIVASDPFPTYHQLIQIMTDDLLCHRQRSPRELCQQQRQVYDPLLLLFKNNYDISLTINYDLAPAKQSAGELAKLEKVLVKTSPVQLVFLYELATISDSTIIALLLAHGLINIDAAWLAINLERQWNERHWGSGAGSDIGNDNSNNTGNGGAKYSQNNSENGERQSKNPPLKEKIAYIASILITS